jgi:hypothetical protein
LLSRAIYKNRVYCLMESSRVPHAEHGSTKGSSRFA